MNEILAPVGSIEAFYAAISNGADALYLGLDRYSARAYADNFNLDNLEELVSFAHLRNVKIYITINTIIYDHELEEVYKVIDKLAELHIDAIIVQDLAVLSYIVNNYKSLPVHASTQMGIDDIYGAKLVKQLGVKRVVVGRETPLEVIRDIKEKIDIEVEAFVHGALCVCYSGNCLMSSSIGERSGNRGRCAGICRKMYTLVEDNIDSSKGYLLSLKDLNTANYLNKMKFIDSFKIEGRMKEASYVGIVTKTYKDALNNKKDHLDNLNKVFNRTYTEGYINHADIETISNIEKPNNYGEEIGVVDRQGNGKLWIKLFKPLSKGDQIRIETPYLKEEISIFVSSLYNSSFQKCSTLTKMAIIDYDEKVMGNAKVYKTKDSLFLKEFEQTLLNKEYSKLDVDFEFMGYINKPIILKATYNKIRVVVKSEYIVEESSSSPTSKEDIISLLSRLNDTPYKLRNSLINVDENIFIPLKLINELRRDVINKLNEARLNEKVIKNEPSKIIPQELSKPLIPSISVQVSNQEQYKAALEANIKDIYYKNIYRRNNTTFNDKPDNLILVGGLNGIEYFKDKNKYLVSDYSLNVVNYVSVGILSSLGVNKITLSHEISKESIKQLIKDYKNEYHTYPSLELIVYGRTTLMHSKYCVLKRLHKCGECKKHQYKLKDDYASFPLSFNNDCTMNIYNSKILNNIDDIDDLEDISSYRLVFTDESSSQVSSIINILKDKIKSKRKLDAFNKDNNTHGHFYNNPL